MKKNLTCLAMLFALTTLLYRCGKPESAEKTTALSGAVGSNAAAIASFVHPGILNTTASLNYIGNQVNTADPARSADYQVVENYVNSHTVSSTFPSVVVVGSNGETSPSKNQIRNDCEMGRCGRQPV